MRHTPLATVLFLTLALGACSDAPGTLSAAATQMTLEAAGVQVRTPMPDTGCSGSVIEPAKVVDLINTLPEEHRWPVAKILDVSSSAWTMQFYLGDQGMGLCLPVQNALLLMPEPSAPTSPTESSAAP